jgi:hypothetical protein
MNGPRLVDQLEEDAARQALARTAAARYTRW